MAQAFNLTAQLQLQSPRNVNQVVNDIRRQLKPVGIQVKIENTRNLARANKDLAAFSRNARNSNKNMSELNRTLQESARRFSVITIATGSFLALANAFKKSVKEAIAFERELVRISQVTGKTVRELSDLSNEVTRLSTALGASSSDLLSVARTLTQAGFAAGETRKALDILAKTSLGATFDNIQDTTEGAIALLRQFGDEAKRSGGDIKFLESSLDAINSVSKRFAVESGDLITAIRRTGGVFAAAGGSVNELIALFTSVRATTRESAETIATGLRTIFTRIQRVETIEQLKALNIQLQDSEGRFVGAFEAVKRLSQGLKGLDPSDFRFAQIAEELGGFRQIGKVLPLIQQFTTAQEALNVAQGASGSVSRDAITAQQSLGVQIQKVRENFDALIRKFADSSTFRSIASFAIKLADAFIKVADSLEPLLPLLVSLVGLKLGRGIAPALAGIAGIGRRASGSGVVSKFASGGVVPGTGNRDTVPAMLTPGEFVIRKSSVESIGAENLAKMNSGGVVQKFGNGDRVQAQKKNAKNKKIIVSRGTGFERSHIGDDIVLDSAKIDSLIDNTRSIKFKRSFVANVLGKDIKKTNDTTVRSLYDKNINNPKYRGQIKSKLNLTARTPLKLNFPKNYNQALRISDARMVGQSDLSNFIQNSPNSLFDPFPAGLKKAIKSSKIGYEGLKSGLVSTIQSLPAKKPNTKENPNNRLAFDSDFEIAASKNYLKKQLTEISKNQTDKLFGKADIFFKASGFRGRKSGERAGSKFNLGGIIQKFANGGGVEGQKKNAYIFDFDDTLATTEAKGFKEFSDPKFVKSALATRYASLAKRRASQGDDIHVLTARSGGGGVRQAIAEFMAGSGIPTKSVIAVGKAFPKDREPGKRPGTTRKLSTASKKAKVLSKLSKNYGKITFLDDNAENLIQASKVKGVSAVEAKESKLFKNKKNLGGFIQKFGAGGTVKAGDLRRGDILDSGEIVRGALAVGNRTKRRVSLTLEKDGNKKTETVDFYKKFGLKSKGKAIEPIKLAAGGIVDQKAAGAAILDPEPASSKSVTIGVEDVKKKFSEFSKLAKGKDPVSKFYKSTSFDVAKSGLNKETSDKFKIALEDGLIAGVNTSASILANDLGTPNAKIDQSQATNFVKGINTQVFGRLFETTVDSINRQGNYDKPDNNPNRPFDAEQGLPSVLKDNFKGLPDKFIDLKTSAAAASDANLKGKILDQIKIELIRDGILNADYPGKAGKDKDRAAREAKDEKQRQADKAVGRGFPARRNAGGPAPSDTVPALLTPGEFVFNKKAADSIGRANLDRMNKQGVQGFAAGGIVTSGRNNYGIPSGRSRGLSTDTATTPIGLDTAVFEGLVRIEQVFESLNVKGEQLETALVSVEKSLEANVSEADAFDKAFKELRTTSQENKDAAEAQAATEREKRKNAGAAEKRQQGSVVKVSDVAEKRQGQIGNVDVEGVKKRLESELSSRDGFLGASAGGVEQGLKAFNQELKRTGSGAKALEAAIRTAEKQTAIDARSTNNLTGAREKFKKILDGAASKIKSGASAVGGAVGGAANRLTGGLAGKAARGVAGSFEGVKSKEGRKAFAGGLNQAASSAQNFVFLGATVAAVTSQMSGLEETTKTAINETAGFATGLVGIGGTLLQVFTSMAATGATEIVSEEINTQATNKNTESQLRNSAAGSKAASAIGVFAVGFIAGISALKYFSSKATAEADQLSKGLNDALGKIKEGAEANANDLKASAKKEIEARNEAANFTLSPTSGQGVTNLAGAAAGALGGAKLGAIIGTAVAGPVGTAVGGLIGSIAGGIGGALLPSVFASNELTEAQKRQTQEINNSIDSLISLNTGISDLKQANEDIAKAEAAGVSNQELVSRGLEAGAGAGAGVGAATGFQGASNTLAELAEQAGKTVAELKESDFEGDPGALLKFNLATQEATSAQELAAAQAKLTGDTLARAFKDTDASKTFDELVAAGGPFAQALRQNIAAVKQESAIRQIALEQQIAEIQRRKEGASGEELDALTKQEEQLRASLNKEQERGIQAQKDVVTGLRASQNARRAEVIAVERAKQESVALAAALAKTETFLTNLNKIELNLDRQSDALDNFAAIIDNTAFKIKASGVDEIGNVANVGDLAKFSSQISSLTGKFGPEAQKIGNELTQSASVLKNARGLIGKNFGLSGTINADQVLKNLGLTKEALGPGGDKIFNQIASALRDVQGTITEEDFANIFAPLENISTKQAEVLQRLVGINQKEIDNFVKFLDNKEKLRQKEIEQKQKEIQAIQKFAETQDKVTSLLAKSRGVEEDPAANARRQRLRAQRGVRARNQATVSGITVNGSQLNAGNIGQVSRVRKSALAERREIQQRIAAGESGKRFIARQKALQNVIDSTTKVLQEFNESGQEVVGGFISEIEANVSAIEKERQSRQAVIGVLEEFVVGGQEARVGIVNAFAGVRQAFATGSLQFQNPEQRAATVGLLDKLADIELAPGFTGSQIKQELILRDTRALQGIIPPELIIALANSETAEQKLVKTNEALAIEIRKLTAATVASVKALGGDEPAVGAATGGLIQYRQNGGTIFQPKGTDTVPAMLTPGEFVIRKSAVDKIGVGALQQINNGSSNVVPSSGSTKGFNLGGSVRYLDDGGILTDEELERFQSLSTTPSSIDLDKIVRDTDQRIQRNKSFAKYTPFKVALGGARLASYFDPTGISDTATIAGGGALSAFTGDPTGEFRSQLIIDATFGALGAGVAGGVGKLSNAKKAQAGLVEVSTAANKLGSPEAAAVKQAEALSQSSRAASGASSAVLAPPGAAGLKQAEALSQSSRAASGASSAVLAPPGAAGLKQAETLTAGASAKIAKSVGKSGEPITKEAGEAAAKAAKIASRKSVGSGTVLAESASSGASKIVDDFIGNLKFGKISEASLKKGVKSYGRYLPDSKQILTRPGLEKNLLSQTTNHEKLHSTSHLFSILKNKGLTINEKIISQIATKLGLEEKAVKIMSRSSNQVFNLSKADKKGQGLGKLYRAVEEEYKVAQALKYGQGIKDVDMGSVANRSKELIKQLENANPAEVAVFRSKLGRLTGLSVDNFDEFIKNVSQSRQLSKSGASFALENFMTGTGTFLKTLGTGGVKGVTQLTKGIKGTPGTEFTRKTIRESNLAPELPGQGVVKGLRGVFETGKYLAGGEDPVASAQAGVGGIGEDITSRGSAAGGTPLVSASNANDLLARAKERNPEEFKRIETEVLDSPWLYQNEPVSAGGSKSVNKPVSDSDLFYKDLETPTTRLGEKNFQEAAANLRSLGDNTKEGRIKRIVSSFGLGASVGFGNKLGGKSVLGTVQKDKELDQQAREGIDLNKLERDRKESEIIREIIIQQEREKFIKEQKAERTKAIAEYKKGRDADRQARIAKGTATISDFPGEDGEKDYRNYVAGKSKIIVDAATKVAKGKAEALREGAVTTPSVPPTQQEKAKSLYKDLRPDPGPANIARLQNLSLQGIDPEKVETWTDNTNKFSTQAKYRGITDAFQGKGTNTGTNTILNLEKKDGTGIGVPKDKLSDESKSLAAKYYRALGYAKGGEVSYLRFGGFGGSSFGRGYGAQSSLGAAYFGQMPRSQALMRNRALIGRNRMFGRAAAGRRFMRGRAAAGLGFMLNMLPAAGPGGGRRRRGGGAGGGLRDDSVGLAGVPLAPLFGRSIDGVPLVSLIDNKKDYGGLGVAAALDHKNITGGSLKAAVEEFFRLRAQFATSATRIKRSFSAGGFTDDDLDTIMSYVQDVRQESGIRLASGGKVPYFASGGGVGGDSVPAMLTPGEFVMSANTVKKHGVGFMNRLNKGNLPGFNKGGSVGGVQYRQEGGIMDMFSGAAQSFGIDTSKIEGVFGGFVDSFSSVFDNIIGPFSGIAESLRSITEAFGNFDMQHTVNGDLSLNIQGINSEVLKSEISKYVVGIIGTEVLRVMNDQQKNFKSIG